MQGIDTNTIKLDRPGDSKQVHAIFKLKLPANTAQLILIGTVAKL
jgi:hypothetical protein